MVARKPAEERTCPICSKTLCHMSAFHRHLKRHERGTIHKDGSVNVTHLGPNREKVKCPVCKKYTPIATIAHHAKEVCGGTWIGCVCGKFVKNGFPNISKHGAYCESGAKLAREMMSCPDCGKYFNWMRSLKEHTTTTNGQILCKNDRPIEGTTCPGCEEVFEGPKEWRIHTDFCDPYKEYRKSPTVKCWKCLKRVPKHRYFKELHAEECGSFLCKCGKFLRDKSHAKLKRHCDSDKCEHAQILIEQSLYCSKCDAQFSTYAHYARHIKSSLHQKDVNVDYAFLCFAQECDAAFASDLARRGHLAFCKFYQRATGGGRDRKTYHKKLNKEQMELRRKVKEEIPFSWAQKVVHRLVRKHPKYHWTTSKLLTFRPAFADTIVPLLFQQQRIILEVDNEHNLGYNNVVEAYKRQRIALERGWRIIYVSFDTLFYHTETVADSIMTLVEDYDAWNGESTVTL